MTSLQAKWPLDANEHITHTIHVAYRYIMFETMYDIMFHRICSIIF